MSGNEVFANVPLDIINANEPIEDIEKEIRESL